MLINKWPLKERLPKMALRTIEAFYQRVCSRCDRNWTTRQKHRKMDGSGYWLHDKWYGDGQGGHLCHTCYAFRRRRQKGAKPKGRRQLVSEIKEKEYYDGELTLRGIRKLMPPIFMHRDPVDIYANIVEVVSKQTSKMMSFTAIKAAANLSTILFREVLGKMFEGGLIIFDTLANGRSVIKTTDKGSFFLKIYRHVIELVAWPN